MSCGPIRLGICTKEAPAAWHVKAEYCKSLDVHRWKREGCLRDGYSGGWRWTNRETGEETGSIGYRLGQECSVLCVTLIYRSGEHSISERIRVDETTCHFGGSRAWFQCPRCYMRLSLSAYELARHSCDFIPVYLTSDPGLRGYIQLSGPVTTQASKSFNP